MALCEYELQRQQRIAANRRKLEEMGVLQLTSKFREAVQQSLRVSKKPREPRAPRDLVHAPKRKSSRLEGKPAKNYDESVLLKLDKPDRQQRSNMFDRHVVSREEIYTEEHIKLLGDYQEPWELFKDGYDNQGNRIYDKFEGKTCHQCRQKTLGRHTSCSECETLHGVFCGDCLFMRYGENILEVEKLERWVCPPCRGLCNCSFHRIRSGWAPTGTLYRRAIAEGFKSVAHYLVLSKQAGEEAAAAPAEVEAAAQPAAEPPMVDQAGKEAGAEEAPQPSGNAGLPAAAAKADGRSAVLRQSHINNLLTKTKRAAPKAAKAMAGQKRRAEESAVPAMGLGRLTRSGLCISAEKAAVAVRSLAVKKGPRACVQKRLRARRS